MVLSKQSYKISRRKSPFVVKTLPLAPIFDQLLKGEARRSPESLLYLSVLSAGSSSEDFPFPSAPLPTGRQAGGVLAEEREIGSRFLLIASPFSSDAPK